MRGVTLDQVRRELKELSEEEERMTLLASERDNENLNAISSIKVLVG